MSCHAPHLWLALSPHGYGHATMTAPLITELRRRRPDLRLTIQTTLPRDFLATRYDDFQQVAEIADFGFCMFSPTQVDVTASAARYRALHADFPARVAHDAALLRAGAPDLVLANIPYVTMAAARQAGIPVVGFSSLNWADLADHFFRDLPDCDALRAEMRAAYGAAEFFLRPTPAQPMTLPRLRHIGPVAQLGRNRRPQILDALGLAPDTRLGLIAFGGMDHRLPLDRWEGVEGWFWFSSLLDTPVRPDMATWQAAGLSFADLFVSMDVVIGKTGYGTFSEAGVAGIPVLYEARPDWPEAPPIEHWLAQHAKCLAVQPQDLMDGGLKEQLQKLFLLPDQSVALPCGVMEGADALEQALDRALASSNAVVGAPDHHAEASNGG